MPHGRTLQARTRVQSVAPGTCHCRWKYYFDGTA